MCPCCPQPCLQARKLQQYSMHESILKIWPKPVLWYLSCTYKWTEHVVSFFLLEVFENAAADKVGQMTAAHLKWPTVYMNSCYLYLLQWKQISSWRRTMGFKMLSCLSIWTNKAVCTKMLILSSFAWIHTTLKKAEELRKCLKGNKIRIFSAW